MTTDSLVEDVHFRRDWTDWESLGHKIPRGQRLGSRRHGRDSKLAVISLGLDGDERVGDLQALYRGLGSLARRHGMTIAGGDIVRSPMGLFST